MPPASPTDVFCKGHLVNAADGTAATPPIVEPDDPALLEREARKAAEQEAAEYAERRKVKTWKTLENGSRVPEEYWTDEDLAKIEAETAQHVADRVQLLEHRFASKVTTPSHTWEFDSRTGEQVDRVKQATKAFKRALRGRYGPAAEKMAWAFVESLDDH